MVQEQTRGTTPVGREASAGDARVRRTRRDVSRAALEVLLSEGWDALTHARVAREAGYSKATLYRHWPSRVDLARLAFAQLSTLPHHEPTGDLRADLLAELSGFRQAVLDLRLERALIVLADLGVGVPEMRDVRDALTADGERVVRTLLAGHLTGSDLEAATLMLTGAVVHSALLHGRLPDDEVVTAAVDLVLRAVLR